MPVEAPALSNRMSDTLELLWGRSRFVSYFYQAVDFVESRSVPTIALDHAGEGAVLYYNRDFVERSNVEDLVGLLVHEILHIVHNHRHRARPGADPTLQNLAQDMVINSYMRSRERSFFSRTGGDSPPRLLIPDVLPLVPERFTADAGIADPSWEDVYRWLVERPDERPADIPVRAVETEDDFGERTVTGEDYHPQNAADRDTDRRDVANVEHDDSGEGIVFRDDEGNVLPTGMHLYRDEERKRSMDSLMERVFSLARQDAVCRRERAFGEIEVLVRSKRDVDITAWRSQLKSYIDYASHTSEWKYSYSRFNRRYFAGGIYAPGRVFVQKQTITVVVDVSGSMVVRPADLEAAFGVIEELLGRYTVNLVCVDEGVYIPRREGDRFVPSGEADRPYRYRAGDWKYLRTEKSGTTFFAPLFNEFMKGHREMLVVITDGYIYDLHELKKYSPTLWVISSGRGEPFVPPFGKAVTVRL
jgi:predicted metal-dependent peptidase